MVEAVKQNYPQREIADAAFELQERDRRGDRIVVGVNAYTEGDDGDTPILRIDPALERKQIDRVQAVRARRDATAVEAALAGAQGRGRAATTQPDAAPAGLRARPRHRGRDHRRRCRTSSAPTPRRPSSETPRRRPYPLRKLLRPRCSSLAVTARLAVPALAAAAPRVHGRRQLLRPRERRPDRHGRQGHDASGGSGAATARTTSSVGIKRPAARSARSTHVSGPGTFARTMHHRRARTRLVLLGPPGRTTQTHEARRALTAGGLGCRPRCPAEPSRPQDPRRRRQARPRRARPRREDHRPRAARRGHGGHLHRPAPDARADRRDGAPGGRRRRRAVDPLGRAHDARAARRGAAARAGAPTTSSSRSAGRSPRTTSRELKELGVAEVFTPGAPTSDIIDFIRGAVTP